MKNKLKGLLAVALSAACFLSTTPITGFAAGKQTVGITEGAFSVTDADGNGVTDASVIESDEITKADDKGHFYVTVNGEKASEGYGENTYEGYIEANAEAEKSGSVYYDSFTVPAAPKGYRDGAAISVKQSSDYYSVNDAFHLGNIVNLEYEPVSYKVTFDLNGGEGTIDAVETKYGTEFTLPASDSASKDGLSITGWNTVADGSGTNYEPGASVKNLTETDGAEIVLFAQWGEKSGDTDEETKTYVVYYYLSDSEEYSYIQEYAEGEKITLPAAPEKKGFTFAGWILGEENGEVIPLPDTMPANDIKAYASWEIKDTTVKYIVDGEEYSSKSAAYGSDIALTAPEDPAKEGYTFAGWFDADGNNLYSYTTVPADDITFTAKWLKNGNVVYMVDDKTYEAYEVLEGDEIPVPENPEKFAYKFRGWSPDVPSAMPAEDLTFTAQWELDKDFVTIVVGGTVIAGGVVATIIGAGAAAITGISIIGGIIALIGVASNINKTYTVTYKVDGAVYKTYKLSAGSKITVPADPTKDGCKFAGWTPEIPDEMPKKNLTFEATWTEIKDNSNVDTEIPSTGSAGAGIAAFAALALSAAVAVIIKKKKDK